MDAMLAKLYPTMAAQEGASCAACPKTTDGDASAKPAQPCRPSQATSTDPAQPPPQTEAEAAKRLFPGMQEQPEPAKNPSVPEAIRELREADKERQMYSPQKGPMASAIPDDFFATVADDSITPEMKQAATAELREIATDLGATQQEVENFIGLYKQNLANPPTDEQTAKWHKESLDLLKGRYGDGAEHALDMAKKLLQRDPRVKSIIVAGNLGNHPKVVLAVAEAAIREVQRGRLK